MSNKDDLMGIEHLDHCIDMLRQAIMVRIPHVRVITESIDSKSLQCNCDVTPTTFARTSLDTPMKVVAEVVHTCRSFHRVQQWAWNRRVRESIDKNKVVTDDPLGWGDFTYTP